MQAEEQELALTSVRLPEAPVDLELFIHNHFITQALVSNRNVGTVT